MVLAASLAAIVLQPVSAPAPLSVLVFSETKGFRHDSIPEGKRALYKIAQDAKWQMAFTEDSSAFSESKLKAVDVVVFLCTTGDVLNDQEQVAMESFIRGGGGYFGVHAAADTEYDWPWYGQLVGGYFKSHPKIQEATVKVEDLKHPATKHLITPWKRVDEWYDYRENPRTSVRVLASLDTKSYQGHVMGDDHPIMWCHDFQGGRSFYTGFGHTKESYAEPEFLTILKEGILWTAAKKRAGR